MQKYGFTEARPVLERASARETAARVALGTVAQHYLRATVSAEVLSHVVSIGEADAVSGPLPTPADREAIDSSPVRAVHPDSTAAMSAEIEAAKADGDTLGGVVEVLVYGLPPGLGSFVHADRKLDARLAQAVMSIQAIKGVEIGDGFRTARRRGSVAHDEIDPIDQVGPSADAESVAGKQVSRRSNRAGGIEGGMTNGEVLLVRAAMKPISTVPRALSTVDVRTGEAATAVHQRSDVCAVPAAGVVAEAMVALVLADAVSEKFGGDSIIETRRNIEGYRTDVATFISEQGGAEQGGAGQGGAASGTGPVVAGHPAAGDE